MGELILRIRSAINVLTGRSWGSPDSYRHEVHASADSWRCTRCGGCMNTIVGPRGVARYEHMCNPHEEPMFYGRRWEKRAGRL